MHLLFFTKKNCPQCVAARDTFFKNPKKHKALNAIEWREFKFEENDAVFKFHKVTQAPTVLVVHDGKVVGRFDGALNAIEFSNFLFHKIDYYNL